MGNLPVNSGQFISVCPWVMNVENKDTPNGDRNSIVLHGITVNTIAVVMMSTLDCKHKKHYVENWMGEKQISTAFKTSVNRICLRSLRLQPASFFVVVP